MALTIFFSQYDGGTLQQPGTASSLRGWIPTASGWNALTDEAEVIVPLGGEGRVNGITGLYVVEGTAPGGLDRVYFAGYGQGNPDDPDDPNFISQLWTSDGTEEGTRSLTPFYSFDFPTPTIAGSINGSVYFSAEDFTGQASGIELYIAPVGTLANDDPFDDAGLADNINNNNSGTDSSNPADFVQAGSGEIYFTADDGIHGRELWWIGGASAARIAAVPAPSQMVYDEEGGSLFAVSNGDLFQVNGTSATNRTQDVAGVHTWSSVNLVGDVGSSGVLFTGSFTDSDLFSGPVREYGSGLWRYTRGLGAELIEDNLSAGTGSIKTQGLSGNLFFLGDDSDTSAGLDLWRSNGSAGGTASVGTGLDFGTGLVGGAIDDTLFFVARDDFNSPWQLYRTEGSGAVDITGFEGVDEQGDFEGFTQIGGHLYFFVTQTHTTNLYRIAEDGTGLLQIARDVDAAAGVVGADVPALVNEILGTTGSDASPPLTGTDGRDSIQGLGGNDIIEGKGYRDRIDGGAGRDWASYESSTQNQDFDNYFGTGVQVSLVHGVGAGGHAEGDRLFCIENLRGSAFADDLDGDDLGNTLEGLAGNDFLGGGDGGDMLDGGAGNDIMFGGDGSDDYRVDSMLDEAREFAGEGVDAVYALGSYTLLANSEIEFLTASSLTGTAAISLIGNEFANTVTGNAGANFISAGFGDTAADVLRGRGGNDYYFVNSANDLVDESVGGSGVDTVEARFTFDLSDVTQAKGVVENLRLMGTANINGTGNFADNSIEGNNGVNTLKGESGDDMLNGFAGHDKMFGGAGNDMYVLDSTGDRVYETATPASNVDLGGTDLVELAVTFTLGKFLEKLTLTGSSAINGTGNTLGNTITGNGGANTLKGMSGNDTIDGGGGADLILGGTGRDILKGGAGADVFDFDALGDSVAGANRDTVTFLRAEGDKIDLRTIDADTDATAGNQGFKWVKPADLDAAFTGVDGQLRFAGGILMGDVNGDKRADFEIRIVGALTTADVLL